MSVFSINAPNAQSSAIPLSPALFANSILHTKTNIGLDQNQNDLTVLDEFMQ